MDSAQDLRDFISSHFDNSELKDLCLDLQVDYENLSGERKNDKVRELILHCQRHDQFDKLAHLVQQHRPHVFTPNTANFSPISAIPGNSIKISRGLYVWLGNKAGCGISFGFGIALLLLVEYSAYQQLFPILNNIWPLPELYPSNSRLDQEARRRLQEVWWQNLLIRSVVKTAITVLPIIIATLVTTISYRILRRNQIR